MIIYKTTNLINNKIYIGQSKHNNPFYIGSGKILKKAIKKYGKNNFKKEIITEVNNFNLLNELEKHYIQLYASFLPNIGYNLEKGGSINTYEVDKKIGIKNKNKKLSKEARLKISESRKGKKLSKEIRDKLSKALEGNKHALGMKHTEKTKEKIRNTLLKLNQTPERKKKNKKTAKERVKKYPNLFKQKELFFKENQKKFTELAAIKTRKPIKLIHIDTKEELIFNSIKSCVNYFNVKSLEAFYTAYNKNKPYKNYWMIEFLPKPL